MKAAYHLSLEERQAILDDWLDSNLTWDEIVEKYGRSRRTISRVVAGRSRSGRHRKFFNVTYRDVGVSRIVTAPGASSWVPGANSQYKGGHMAINREARPATNYLCEGGCQSQATNWANVHGTDDFIPMCRSCHLRYDLCKKQR